ncbi:MAG TPA: hypothetical protein ENK27_09670 [Desulfobulbus sp.]|nr:hypothetical protein [Desulfobulbus sp.]
MPKNRSRPCRRLVRAMPVSLAGAGLLLFGIATPALAIQAHGAPEGLYVHEIGHFLYALAMLGFTFQVIRNSRLAGKPGWRLMSRGALLLFLWNLWALVAHVIDTVIPARHFLVDDRGLHSILVLQSGIDYLYCLFRMDHLICVPALLLIYLGLRHMAASGPVRPEGPADT